MSYEQDAVLPSQEKLSSLMNRAGIPQPSDIDSILAAVAAHYGCTSDQLRENNKEKRLTLPRQIAMFLCRDILGESFPSIGLIFGGRDHSTVIYATRKIEKMKVTNKDMNIQLTELTKQCRNSVPRRKT
jgi:chromosomal replication initiator protein